MNQKRILSLALAAAMAPAIGQQQGIAHGAKQRPEGKAAGTAGVEAMGEDDQAAYGPFG